MNTTVVIIIAAILIPQYLLALFCLTRLAYLRLPVKKYVAWNIFIMLAVYVGGVLFLILYGKKASDAKKAQSSQE